MRRAVGRHQGGGEGAFGRRAGRAVQPVCVCRARARFALFVQPPCAASAATLRPWFVSCWRFVSVGVCSGVAGRPMKRQSMRYVRQAAAWSWVEHACSLLPAALISSWDGCCVGP
jgi:hypothetical protein